MSSSPGEGSAVQSSNVTQALSDLTSHPTYTSYNRRGPLRMETFCCCEEAEETAEAGEAAEADKKEKKIFSILFH